MKRLAAVMSFAIATAAIADEPAAPAPAPVTAPAPYGKASGLLPGLIVGPKLGVLPVPSVYSFGLEARVIDTIGLTLDYGAWPRVDVPNAASADARMEYRDLSGAVRWFPWKERFYVGAAFGGRSFRASATDSTTGLRGTVKVDSSYVAPEIGWRFIWSSGFFMGIDLGYQIITSTRSSFDLPAGMNAQDQQDLRDAADQLGKLGFPIVSLLQLGFYL